MDIQKAKDELASVAAVAEAEAPKSLDDVIAGLKGFGIEEFEEILTIKTNGRDVRLRISNVPTSDEMAAVLASDEFKGYNWVKKVKVELLSRSISWVDGIDLRKLPADKRYVKDPTDGQVRDIQLALRNSIMGWGHELVEVLWKVLMTHSQRIEDRLKEEFPQSATMTEVEQRLFEQASKRIEEANKVIIQETVAKLYDPEIDGELPAEAEEKK
jgi:hypothetical protein